MLVFNPTQHLRFYSIHSRSSLPEQCPKKSSCVKLFWSTGRRVQAIVSTAGGPRKRLTRWVCTADPCFLVDMVLLKKMRLLLVINLPSFLLGDAEV